MSTNIYWDPKLWPETPPSLRNEVSEVMIFFEDAVYMDKVMISHSRRYNGSVYLCDAAGGLQSRGGIWADLEPAGLGTWKQSLEGKCCSEEVEWTRTEHKKGKNNWEEGQGLFGKFRVLFCK